MSKYLSFDMLLCIDEKKNILVKKRAIFAHSLAKKGVSIHQKSQNLKFFIFFVVKLPKKATIMIFRCVVLP